MSTARWIGCQKEKDAFFTGAGKEGKNLKVWSALKRALEDLGLGRISYDAHLPSCLAISHLEK